MVTATTSIIMMKRNKRVLWTMAIAVIVLVGYFFVELYLNYVMYMLDQKFFASDEDVNRNVTIWNMTANTTVRPRGRFTPGPIELEFVADLQRLRTQLQENYSNSSSCTRIAMSTEKATGIEMCYGLGTTVGRMNHYVLTNMMQGNVLRDLDEFTCHWFQQDNTKICSTMFGDCYFAALSAKRSDHGTAVPTCHDMGWFGDKYGDGGLHAGHLSWLLSDAAPPPEPESCVALHIRRGDACINQRRGCFEYKTYYRAAEIFFRRYPELNRLVVLTDDDTFPVDTFQTLVKNITYSDQVDRNKYNVQSLANRSFEEWAPEFRSLNNSASELFAEVSEAVQCQVLVGTLTSGISKWIYLAMMTRQGRLPMFYSLQGCMSNAFYWEQCWEEEECEEPFI